MYMHCKDPTRTASACRNNYNHPLLEEKLVNNFRHLIFDLPFEKYVPLFFVEYCVSKLPLQERVLGHFEMGVSKTFFWIFVFRFAGHSVGRAFI